MSLQEVPISLTIDVSLQKGEVSSRVRCDSHPLMQTYLMPLSVRQFAHVVTEGPVLALAKVEFVHQL